MHSSFVEVPSTSLQVCECDFSARVSRDHTLWNGTIGRHGIGSCNANGESLLNLCNSHDLVITNTVFQQSNRYKSSWHHPRSKHWHLLDYVIVRSRDIHDVNITRAMVAADDCCIDHHLIRSVMCLQIAPKHWQKA